MSLENESRFLVLNMHIRDILVYITELTARIEALEKRIKEMEEK